MRHRINIRALLALAALLTVSPALVLAQDDRVPAPEVSASVDRVEAFVGDALTFVISVIADSTTTVAPLTIDEKLGDFEIQEIQLSDAESLKDGRKRYQTTLKLWALETGEREIPSVAVYYTNPGVAVDSILTSSLTVTVSSVVGETIDSASIRPLRDALEDPLGLKRGFLYSGTFWGLLAALALITGALLSWFVFRKPQGEVKWVDPRSSWEIALDRLADLRNEPLLAQGLFKQYYSELTDTLRDYLGSALDTHTLDMTTAELLATLERGSVTVVYKPQIASTLAQADMIKFAKATPASGRPEKDFETVYSVIVSIRDDLAENRRKEQERLQELKARKNSNENGDMSDAGSDYTGASDRVKVKTGALSTEKATAVSSEAPLESTTGKEASDV
jgi:hypothetical protein